MGLLKEAREAWELGRTLQLAVQRGRKLHPWISTEHSLRALKAEVQELQTEIYAWQISDNDSPHRIKDEALDCAVVAIRIMLGY